jgi:hypothetical protein
MTILWLFTDDRHPEYPVGTFLAGDTRTGVTIHAAPGSAVAGTAQTCAYYARAVAATCLSVEQKHPLWPEFEASERAKDAARMALLKRDGVTVKGGD